jgi:mitochondrial cardiolipin hydrolase
MSAEPSIAVFSPGNGPLMEIIRQFDRARKTADVCVFTITDDRISSAIQRAHDRGVEIRILSDDDKSFDEGSDIQRLKSGGIACRMDVGRTAHMHHKFAIFDGQRLLTGSFNWTRSATDFNEENLLVTSDPVLVQAFADRFEKLWVKFADA